ncbi:hypothetical protein MKW92_019937, partial [Papaver armeniacum]
TLWEGRLDEAQIEFSENPRSLLTHPIFWSDETCLNFILKVRQILGKCSGGEFVENEVVQDFLAKVNVVGKSNWHQRLVNDHAVLSELHKKKFSDQKPYDKEKTTDLLRFMRDMFSHFVEKSPAFQ